LSTPVAVDVPVAVGVAVWIAHEAESRSQPAGMSSFRSRVVVGAYEISWTEPLPVIVQLVSVVCDASDALKSNSCVVPAGATLTIVRKPLFGEKMQSDGSEFGSPDG
jgi:hypothetical protein